MAHAPFRRCWPDVMMRLSCRRSLLFLCPQGVGAATMMIMMIIMMMMVMDKMQRRRACQWEADIVSLEARLDGRCAY